MAPEKNLSIFYQNVNGLRTKCLELSNNILINDFDIIVITESWLQDDILDRELCDNRYVVFRVDRNLSATGKCMGGGIVIFVRTEMDAYLNSDWSSLSVESQCITISACVIGSTVDLHIITSYIPPDENLSYRVDCFRRHTVQFMNKYNHDNFLILGDFNLPCINWSDDCNFSFKHNGPRAVHDVAVSLMDDFTYYGLTQYNYLTNKWGNVLDLCFSNLPVSITRCLSPLIKEDVAHPSFCLSISDLQIKPLHEHSVPTYNFHKCDYDKINKYLKLIDWYTILNTNCIDEAVDIFYTVLYECFRLFVPRYRPKLNCHYPFWYSAALIKLIREKHKMHSKWKKYGNPRDYDEFSLLRSREAVVQAQCFDRFITNSQNFIRYSPKYFWKYVKSKRGGSNYPNKFELNNVKYTDGNSISSAFNYFFKSVFIHSSHDSTINSCLINNNYIPHDMLSCIEVNEDIVNKLLCSLDRSKGAGSDGIPPLLLSSCAESLALPIYLLFRFSLNECVFPSVWKKAQVVPIHKKGSRSLIDNYRPISILNCISKVFEKLVYKQIYPLISRGIPYSQHGFVKGRSTVSNLALFSDYVLNEMEGGGQVDVIYTDFEKAFDRVDHNILLCKLQALGIHGDLLRWIQSYLSNRSQLVVIGGYKSDSITVPSGVPQGSHLATLFYNAYLFDIADYIKVCGHIMYADDKKVYLNIRSIADCVSLQSDLASLQQYYSLNKITINVAKCQIISFTRKRDPIVFNYSFNGVTIQRVSLVRDLGVFFDAKMLLSNHVEKIVQRAYRNLGFVIRTCIPFKCPITFKVVYFAYVRSILEYASPIWSPCYMEYIKRIEGIQCKFVKHLSFKTNQKYTTYLDSCRIHNLLTLEERRQMLDICLLYDILRNRLDSPELVQKINFNVPTYRTRHTSLFHIPHHSTNYGMNSVCTRLVKLCNKHFADIDLFHVSKHILKSQIKIKIKKNLKGS